MSKIILLAVFLVVLAVCIAARDTHASERREQDLAKAVRALSGRLSRRSDCGDLGDECGWMSGCCDYMKCEYDSLTGGHCMYPLPGDK